MVVDVIWWLLLFYVAADGQTYSNHDRFDTRRQCMSSRSVHIEEGEKLIKTGEIKSFTVECVPVEVSKSGLKSG